MWKIPYGRSLLLLQEVRILHLLQHHLYCFLVLSSSSEVELTKRKKKYYAYILHVFLLINKQPNKIWNMEFHIKLNPEMREEWTANLRGTDTTSQKSRNQLAFSGPISAHLSFYLFFSISVSLSSFSTKTRRIPETGQGDFALMLTSKFR